MFSGISNREKTLLAGLGLVLLGCTLFYFVFLPQLKTLKNLNNQLTQKRARLQEARAVLASEKVERERAELVERDLLKYRGFFATEFREGTALMLVGDKVSELGLEIINFEPRGVEDKGEFLQLPLELELQGSYSGILLMLKELENLPNISEIRSLSLSPGTGGLISSGVNARCHLVIYCDTSPEGKLQLESEGIAAPQIGRENPFIPPSFPSGDNPLSL